MFPPQEQRPWVKWRKVLSRENRPKFIELSAAILQERPINMGLISLDRFIWNF